MDMGLGPVEEPEEETPPPALPAPHRTRPPLGSARSPSRPAGSRVAKTDIGRSSARDEALASKAAKFARQTPSSQ